MTMHTLEFSNDEAGTLAQMLEHANTHKRMLPYCEGETEEQGLWLVKDRGIYLMSPTDCKFEKVVYASGYEPTDENRDTFDDLWGKTYQVSSDDFVEFVPLSPRMVRIVLDGCSITIELVETKMSVSATPWEKGEIIFCPKCAADRRVFHFNWSAVTCTKCKAVVEKSDWLKW